SSNLPAEAVAALRAQSTHLAGIEVPEGWSSEVRIEAKQAVDGAFLLAFESTCYFAAGLVWLAALCAAIGIRAKPSAPV
ncbi:MAG: hypothetical protein AAF658_18715, partial [Myxococcota bacterium]